MTYEEVEFSRDCQVVQIPDGTSVTVPAGTSAVITQALGDSYTIQIPTWGGLYRIGGKDADAIGKALAACEGDDAAAGPVTDELVYNQLRNVYDPEIPVNIVELGLVYDLRIEETPTGKSSVHVKMTLTAPGCGMGDVIAHDAKTRIQSLPGVEAADVQVVFEPPWSQEMMSEAAKLELGIL